MIKYNIKTVAVILLLSVFADSCTGKKAENIKSSEEVTAPETKPVLVISNETSMLLKDLEENGDYVNSREFPSLIKASVVNESIGKNLLVVDLRSPEQFREGHIEGAVNRKFEELPAWFESGIKPFEYDKIIMVCNDGQLSSYTTCLLRLMGYGNVFAMRWGMSSWNSRFANEGWLKDVSGKFEAQLETKVNERPASTGMPDLRTGFATGAEIGTARFKKLFEESSSNIQITADEVFANPQSFFVINLERKDKYEDGHIPGAVRYKPEATLGFTEEMASIPADKTVVVYCGTGHNSAFASAYLRLFGYDARTLKYGNNSFMYNKMVAHKTALSWLPFSSADVNDFKTVK
jgi:rhodanese-related sulfurtransferase